MLTACCCIDLAVGTEILGWLKIIFTSTYLMNTQIYGYPNIFVNIDNVIGSTTFQLLFGALMILVWACGIAGARKKNKKLLVPWLVANLVQVVFIVFELWYQAFKQNQVDTTSAWLFLLADILSSYFLIVVVSLYLEIDLIDTNRAKRIFNASAPPTTNKQIHHV